jgi:imidazolonepropionase-like amidohydrolase
MSALAVALAATVLVRHGTVWTQGPAGTLEDADLLVRDGKIVEVGRSLSAPSNATVIDARGKHVTPGLIDCHSHTAIRGGVNEGSNNVTAEVRIDDVIDPKDVAIYRELAGGLTTANLLHGSANSIGGQNAVVKLHYKTTREAMLFPGAPPGIKFALGENPKRSNFRDAGRPQRYPNTRMGVMESIRAAFSAAKRYREEWAAYDKLSAKAKERREPPRHDLQLEAIAEILEGKRLIHSHCYRQDEILALLRTAESYGVKVATLQHVLEGYKVADEIAAHGAGASTFSDWWAYKLEAYDAIPHNGALLRDRGVVVSFNSDSDELARRLNVEAAKAVKYGGVPEIDALAFVTINPAKQLRIDGRVGSLEAGKDGDFVIWSGHPLSVYSVAEQTWIDGVREFDRTADRAAVAETEKARAEAIAKIRGSAKPPAPGEAQPAAKPVPAPVPLTYLDRLGASGPAVSIVHATVHTVSGGIVEDGTVSFRAGRIVAVGRGLAPEPGASVVDAAGKHLYPGLIDANTVVGLVEIGSVAGGVDIAETGAINPQAQTAIAINPDSELIPVSRANGITHVVAAPEGGLVSGTSSLIRLSGWTWEDLSAARPVALHIQWPSFAIRRGGGFGGNPPPSEEDQKKDRDEALKKIRRLFDDARAYARAKASRGAADRPLDPDAALEAMLPVLEGRVPVIVAASQAAQIKSAVSWAESEGVRMILLGAGDVAREARLLKEKRIPVIVDGVLSVPSRDDEPYDAAYAVAARLAEAGVSFCISSGGGSFASAMVRNLPYHAGMAAAHGLPKDAALRAITLSAAEVLGVAADLGSIEKGKSASLILTDGDPLEVRTKILASWIDGRPTALDDNKHDRLYRKYSQRPKPIVKAPSP